MSAKFIKYFLVSILISFSTGSLASEKSILPIKKWTTTNGTSVFYVQETELPIVDIQVVLDAGSARDDTKPGLAKITVESLSSGTPSKNANQIAASFDDVGARYSAAASRDMAIVAMRSLSDPKFLTPAFDAFTDVLTHPNFPDSEFTRIQRQTLSSLDEQEEQPASIAAKAFYNAVYNGNPYGHPISGTKESIAKLTAQDLRDFHLRYFTTQNSLIAIVGNVDESKAKQLAENLSAQMNKGQMLSPLAFNVLTAHTQFEHITFPSSQTHVLIGQAAINRNDPKYFPVMVGNYILGGGSLTSRLFDEVREKRGLAYSVRSQFNAMKDRGPFVIELQTRNSEADNAIKVVTNTLNSFLSTGPSDKELYAAKKNLTQGFILRLASNTAIISQLVNIGYYKLPLDYLDQYRGNIEKVTNTQVKDVFQSIIKPNALVTITVGGNVAKENAKKAIK